MKCEFRYILLLLAAALIFPSLAVAQDQAVAVLHPDGYTTVNGQPCKRTTALFSGDVVSTGTQSQATIVQLGSITTLASGYSASAHLLVNARLAHNVCSVNIRDGCAGEAKP